MAVALNRYSTRNVQLTKGGVVVHDTEGGEQLGSAEALVIFMAAPGTRPDGTGSAYHAVADTNGRYIQVLGADCAPFAAPPLNQEWWHIVIPGRADQTREQWLDPASRGYIKAVARFIYDKHLIDAIPLVKVDAQTLWWAGEKALHVGYCGHRDVSDAFGQTDHTDPGPNFPWDVLAAEIRALVPLPPPPPPPPPPPQEDDMPLPVLAYWKGGAGYIVTDLVTYWRYISSVDEATSLVLLGRAMWGNQQSKTFGELDQTFYRNVPQI